MDISKCGYTESTTTLLISYTPIQNKTFKVWKTNVDIVKFFATFPLLMACLVFFFKIFFFGVGHFQSLYWICYNIAYVLCFDFLAERHVWSYLPYQKSNPRSRNRTHAPCINHWTSREVPIVFIVCVCVTTWNSVLKYPWIYM